MREDSRDSAVRFSNGPMTVGMATHSVVTDGPKLLRLASASFATLDAMPTVGIDEQARRWLADAWSHLLDELGTALSQEVVEEFRSLAPAGCSGVPTEGELRVLHAQLAGWLGGVLMAEQLSTWGASIAGAQDLARSLAARDAEPALASRSRSGPSPYL